MIAALQESVKGEIFTLQNRAKDDFRLKNEKLIKRLEKDNQRLSQKFTEKLRSEKAKCLHLLRQVRDETESELVRC
jgi:hypothetical protein